jgi:hypothetical protein
MKLRLLIPAALLLLLGACRHKQAQPETIYVDSATRQHFLFKPGSYWIYKDSVSGRVDSCYVTKLDSSVGRNSDNTKNYQSIFSDIMQRPLINPKSDSIAIGIGLGKGIVAIRYNLSRILENKDFGLLLTYPFHLGSMSSSHDSCIAISNTLDTMLSGVHYPNVISCFCGKYETLKEYAWFHINDSIGIIQIDIYSNDVIVQKWELQRFRILK